MSTTFFLSYSSTDSLLARQIFEELCGAGVGLWFDKAQPKDTVPGHERDISRWLERSVGASQGFVLVLTRNALESGWVAQDIDFAARMAGTPRRTCAS